MDPILGGSDVLAAQWEHEFPAEIGMQAFNLTIRLRRLAMLLDEGLAACGDAAGVKLNDVLFLLALRRVGPSFSLRPTDILKMHSITSGTVTYRIDQLIKQDLAERVPDPTDKRGYLIRLTNNGKRVIDQIIVQWALTTNDWLRPLFTIPNADETFVELLRLYESQIDDNDK